MPSFRPLYRASSVPLDRDNRSVKRAFGRDVMRKKMIRRSTLPEIQEEGLLTPLRRPSSYSGNSPDFKNVRDLEAGPEPPYHQLHSNVEMAAALVDQVTLPPGFRCLDNLTCLHHLPQLNVGLFTSIVWTSATFANLL